jgi:cytochrome c oxidase cbb3-type subunit III
MKPIINLCFLFFIGTTSAFGQGDALFKSKCNTCHIIGKGSTGPDLTGVKAKWEGAGEGELLYQWVKASTTLIASGKSKQAAAIKDYASGDMPNQQVTDEEIDQIFTYIDNYQPPVAKTAVADSTNVGSEAADAQPNYKKNLTMFYGLVIGIVVMLLAIILIAGATKSLLNSKQFQEALAKKNQDGGKLLSVVLLLGLSLFPMLSYAQEAAATVPVTTAPAPTEELWAHIENSEIWLMLMINFVLLGVVFYLKWLFNKFYYMVYPKKIKAKKERLKKATVALTASVPIEEESKILLSHEYDGIRELDNRLPPWWVWGFYLTIVFAIAYLFHYHLLKTGDSQEEAYKKEMNLAQKEIDDYLKSQAMNVDETNVTLLTDESAISSGKAVFEQNCTVCHKAGQGDIGPNLTDEYWLYGNDVKDVFKTIKNGTSNGMPDHASKLNPVQIQQVASYVLSLKYMEGRPPQGEKMSKK